MAKEVKVTNTSLNYSTTRISPLNEITFTCTLENLGDALTDLSLVYMLDESLTYVSNNQSGEVSGQNITFDIGDFDVSEEWEVEIVAKTSATPGDYQSTQRLTDDAGLVQAVTEYDWTSYTFQFVGYFPHDVKNIGNRFPAALIKDGNEEISIMQGGLAHDDKEISVYIYNNYNGLETSQTEVEYILDLQNDAVYEILSDLRFNNSIDCVDLVNIEKGEWGETFDYYNAGYTDNMSLIKLTFLVKYRESRS